MQDNPRAQAPKKERPFLPRLKDGGILARRGELAHKGQDIVPFSFAGQRSTCCLILDPEVAPQLIAWNTHPRTELVPLLEPRSTPTSET